MSKTIESDVEVIDERQKPPLVYKISKANFQPYIPQKPEKSLDMFTFEKYQEMSEEERRSAKVTPLPSRAKSKLKDNTSIYSDPEKDRVNFRRSLTRL
jgi:hypothetical protein